MTQEDKEMLLKDLCARLPYGVIILHKGWNYEWDDELSNVERVVGIDENFIYTKVIDTHTGEEYRDDKYCIDLFDDKPYLRPMSSMTEEEVEEVCKIADIENLENGFVDFGLFPAEGNLVPLYVIELIIDWLNAHHFDYRGLIEKGLALEAPEGMYN